MIDKIIIKPLVGIEGLSLGTTKSEVIDILGVPEATQVRDFKDGSNDEDWKYLKPDLELTFSSDDDWLLGTIDVLSKQATLNGCHIIGLDEKDLLKTLNNIGITQTFLDDEFTEPVERNYFCDEHGLSFWLQDGIVTSIAIFPDHDESGDTPLWPKRQ